VSADPRQVASYAREFLAGLRTSKVLGCGKHFPGLGEGRLDSHHELPVIEKSLKALWAAEYVPLPDASDTAPHGNGVTCSVPASDARFHPGIALEILDYKYLAQENRLPQSDRVGMIWKWAGFSRRRPSEKQPWNSSAPAEICAWCAIVKIMSCRLMTPLVRTAERDHRFARRAADAHRRCGFSRKEMRGC